MSLEALVLPPKFFVAFLNGISKSVFFDDKEMTPEYLKEQIFAESEIAIAGDLFLAPSWCSA